jgi:formamidopyrimidine-DNA glycosylase
MPELPEVETVRKGLVPALEGRRILRVEQRRPDLRFPFPDRMAERLTGRLVERLDRRAKYLLIRLDGGETLLSHLGMSGRYSIEAADGAVQPGDFVHAEPANPRHDHVVLTVEGGVTVRYNDPRRFGFMDLFATAHEDANTFLRDLGPEPNSNSFSSAHLDQALAGRRTPIKAALLDQSIVAGLGNIYVCEALHRARISPRRLSASIPGARAARLAPVVRQVIDEAILAGGSTLRDFAAADGALGYFQHRFRAYGRQGEACPSEGCGGVIDRIIQSGRSTFFCPACQR